MGKNQLKKKYLKKKFKNIKTRFEIKFKLIISLDSESATCILKNFHFLKHKSFKFQINEY